jgi:predicted alpha/beta-fold hydrolase
LAVGGAVLPQYRAMSKLDTLPHIAKPILLLVAH